MTHKKTSAPQSSLVKVYRYGLLPPTQSAERVAEQMWLAHRYQNTLIEIERSRRAAVRAVLGDGVGVAAAAAVVDALATRLDTVRAEIKAVPRGAVYPDIRAKAVIVRDELRAARAAVKAAKHALKDDPTIQQALATINTEHQDRARAARGACGVYWGTYLLIEQAMDAARTSIMDPRYQRWTGDGAVGVQIQHGMSVGELADDTRLQLDQTLQPVPCRGGKARPRVRLRVGSEGRAPIWAEWPMILHRPIPDDARIKSAKVVRRRVAHRDEWSLHLTVETRPMDVETHGVVAVDLGWRQAEGTLRAGGWTDGTTGGDILMPVEICGALTKAADLQSIRDTAMNALRAQLMDWSAGMETLPEAHAERLQWLAQWRSPERFAGLAMWWREHRLAGDETITEVLERWRQRDKHLWLWETHARRTALARRRDGYRVLAAQLAGRYRTLVVERLDLRALAAIPVPESERESHPTARTQRVDTAPSELRSALVQAFRARAGEIVTVPASGPADALISAYRERSGVEDAPVTARISRFQRLAALRATKEVVSSTETPPLA